MKNIKKIAEEIIRISKNEKFEFFFEDAAWEFINWLTKNGFDDYSGIEPRKEIDTWFIDLLPQYEHQKQQLEKQTDIIRKQFVDKYYDKLVREHGDKPCNEVDMDTWSFYSDMHKDEYGTRPHEPHTCKQVVDFLRSHGD